MREGQRRWHAANPDKRRIYEQRRNAKKRGLPHDLTDLQWQITLEAFGNRCAYCGELASQENCPQDGHFVQEHVIALVSGGGYTFGNIVPACEHCNESKGRREHRDWMSEQGYDSDLFRARVEQLVGVEAEAASV